MEKSQTFSAEALQIRDSIKKAIGNKGTVASITEDNDTINFHITSPSFFEEMPKILAENSTEIMRDVKKNVGFTFGLSWTRK